MPPAHAGDDDCRPDERLGPPVAAAYAAAGANVMSAGILLDAEGAGSAEHGVGERRRRLHAFVVLARPRQWVKNMLVVAAPAAAGVLTEGAVPVRVALTFVAFCLLSAGTYMVNDVRDAAEDRQHPRKRRRPVAAGDLEPRTALAAGAAAMVAGLLLCLLVRPLLLAVGGGYLAITLTYSLVWRGIAVADVAAIAAGFVLRAVAGGVAAPVGLSRSFVLVVTFAAVFVAAGKRHAELARPRDPGFPVRRVLAVYTLRRLRQILIVSAGLAGAAYCVWALGPHATRGLPWRGLTIAPFTACLARYGVLLGRGAGETPEELLLDDRILQLFALIWTVAFALSVHDAD